MLTQPYSSHAAPLSSVSYETTPLLLGKRALERAAPARASYEKLLRTGASPTALRDAPVGTLGVAGQRFVMCSGAQRRPAALGAGMLVENTFMHFASGDPFVQLQGELSRHPVAVVQGLSSASAATHLAEAMQAVWAARSAGADDHIVLVLPAVLDPQHYATQLNRLVVKLAKASGAREIHYMPELPGPTPLTQMDQWEALNQQLHQCHTREGAEAVRAAAHSASKQYGRRGETAQQERWRALARNAARVAAPRSASNDATTVVFGNTANPALTASLVHALQSHGPAVLGVASCATTHVDLQTSVEGRDVVIVDSQRPAPSPHAAAAYTGGPGHCFEALLLVQAAREAGAKTVTVVQAYQMNGRSDREEHGVDQTHVGAYSDLVARWFDAAKCDRAVLVECHDLHTPTSWSASKHAHAGVVDGVRLLVDDVFQELTPADRARCILALPDAGSAKRAKSLRALFSQTIAGEKRRTAHNDAAELLAMGNARIDPQTIVVLPDDETATGSTLTQALAMLKSHGAQRIEALLVHNNMPLDDLARQLTLALFVECGATTVRFTDTHAMGTIVQSYADLLDRSDDRHATATRVGEFLTEHQLRVTPHQLFHNLAHHVKVVSAAPAIAQAVANLRTSAPPRLPAVVPSQLDVGTHLDTWPDFPKPGITFRDMAPLLNNAAARSRVVDALVGRYQNLGIDKIAALESRGFIFGGMLAERLGCGFVMLRKPGKVPGAVVQQDYGSEYSRDIWVLQEGRITPGDRVLIVDDLVATGGSATAAIQLIRRVGGNPYEVAALVDIATLHTPKLDDVPVHAALTL